jgi:predicted RNA-binding Zn ribbon-like protein
MHDDGGLDPAPTSARLVREFVNTVEWQVDEDAWQQPDDLASWCSAHLGVRVEGLGDADLLRARRVREGLRALLLMNAGHEPLPSDLDGLDRALHEIPLRLRLTPDGRTRLVSAGGGPLAEPLGVVLAAMEDARAAGAWPRLKACSRATCRWAYWDDSRNGSARWCSMAGCGNFVKMRRRNRPEPPVEDVLPLAGERVRPATLIDVAGRAGVSIKTVSNVVTGTVRVAEPTRTRVVAAIEELGYRPNLAARALRAGAPLLDDRV